jgi:hypothetical protein
MIMKRLFLYFLSLFAMVSVLKAQDTTVIITEGRFDASGNAYVEFTNVGDSDEQMGNYLWAVCHPSNSSPDPLQKLGNPAYFFRFPDTLLGPGESFVVAPMREIPSEWGADLWEKTSKIADFLVYEYEAQAGEIDSASVYDRALAWYGGLPPGFLYYGTPGTGDSVVVDMINASFEGSFTILPDIAGVQQATTDHVLIRKTGITRGIRSIADWDVSRGVDADDSDWIVIPHNGRQALFTTVDHHGDANFSISGKSGSGVNLDLGNGTIEVPYHVRKGDSIINEVEIGEGMAWQYFENPSTADSAFTSVRTGDTLRLFTVGASRETMDLKIIRKDAANTDAIVVPKRYRVFPDEPEAGPFWAAPPYYVTEDYVQDTIGDVPFAERVDSVLAYLIKPEEASWEIEWVDGQERVDLKDGDKLVVTAADGQTKKDYYIAVDEYEPSDNAHLSAITWPDMVSKLGYEMFSFKGDTIPNFSSSSGSYHVTLPLGTEEVPVLTSIPQNPNAQIVTKPAMSLRGSREDRTTVFDVTAEDDSTVMSYKVTFAVQRKEVQPFVADPFISQFTARYYHRSNYFEFFNPGTELISMDNYMFVRGSGGEGPIDAYTNRLSGEDAYLNRLWHYVPGYRYPDEPTFNADPMKLIPDPTVDVILEPGDTWVAGTHGTAGNLPDPRGRGHLDSDPLRIHFTSTIPNQWGETFEWDNVWSWPKRWHHKLYVFKVVNDSILDGDKAIGDPNDVVLIDSWWDADESGPAWDVAGRGDEVANEHGWGFWRKPEIFKGNVDGTSFGTHPDTSEWVTHYWRDNGGSSYDNFGSIIVGLGNHSIEPVTAYISIVNSNTLRVSDGYKGTDESISGDLTGMTVENLFGHLIKFDEGQSLEVKGKAASDAVVEDDTLMVTSADGVNITKYALKNQELSSDAVLTTNSDKIVINVDGEQGSVSNVQFGMKLIHLMDSLTVPQGAKLYVMDEMGNLVPMKELSLHDTSYVDTRVSDEISLKVVAEDFTTQVIYAIETDTEASDAYITSSLYNVNQKRMTVSDLPPAQTVPTFMRNIQPVKGATVNIKDKAGFVREVGYIHLDDVVEVISEDQSVTNIYNFIFAGSINKAPVVNVIWADTTINAGETIDLKADISDDGLPEGFDLTVTWTVINGDAQEMEIVDQGSDWASVEFSVAGEYEVEVMVSDGEFDATDKFSITVEGGTNIVSFNAPAINIYPNPATNYLNLELKNMNVNDVKIKVFNVVGTQIFESAEVNESMKINLSGVEEGLYYILAEGQGYSITRKFTIVK